MQSRVSFLLHPIRMRIIQALLGGRELTAQEIARKMPDVPQATLYRHLNKLLNEQFLTVVQENRIRGTVEKVYALTGQENLTTGELEGVSREEHWNHFFTFMTNLMGDFEQYLKRDRIDPRADGVSYRQVKVFLSDEELATLLREIGELLLPLLDNEPAPGRKLRAISTILIPHDSPIETRKDSRDERV